MVTSHFIFDDTCFGNTATLWLIYIAGHGLIFRSGTDIHIKKGKKPLFYITQAGWLYETVPIGTILSPSECGRKPQGENHQALAVKGERHPTCDEESNPDCSGGKCGYHGAAKPHVE